MIFEVLNMSGDFRLRNSLWGFFVYVWCVVFKQGSCVFIQYNLFKDSCEWILIQPWTQVIDYSLPALTWNTRLMIGTLIYLFLGYWSTVGVIFAITFTFLLFFSFLLFFMIVCWLIFAFCFYFHVFSTVVWAAKNPY